MKWIIASRPDSDFHNNIDDVFRAETNRSDAVLLSNDVDDSLRMASEALVAAKEARDKTDQREYLSVIVGNGCVNTMSTPNCPNRAIVHSALSQVRSSDADTMSSTMVSVSITSFSGLSLEKSVSLAPQLAEGCGLSDQINNNGSTTFDNFLKLNFGGRRAQPPYVEIRNVLEWDGLINALFSSAAFQRAMHTVSMKVTIKLQRFANNSVNKSDWEEAYTCWMLHDRHVEEYLRKTREVFAAHNNVRVQQFSVGVALISQMSQIMPYANVARSLWEVSATSSEKILSSVGRHTPFAKSQQAASPSSKTDILAGEIAKHEERKRNALHRHTVTDISKINVPSPSAAIQVVREELAVLGQEYDDAECSFNNIAKQVEVERDGVAHTDAETRELQRRVADNKQRAEELESERITVAAQLKVVTADLERARLQQESTYVENSQVMKVREEAAYSLQQARDAEERRYKKALDDIDAKTRHRLEQIQREGTRRAEELRAKAKARAGELDREQRHLQYSIENDEAQAGKYRTSIATLRVQLNAKTEAIAQLRVKIQELQSQADAMNRSMAGEVADEASASRKRTMIRIQQRIEESLEQRSALKTKALEIDHLIATLEQQVVRASDQSEHETTVLYPKLQHQLQDILRGIQNVEGAQRALLYAEYQEEWELLARDEILSWKQALNATEDEYRNAVLEGLKQKVLDEERDLQGMAEENVKLHDVVTALKTQIAHAKERHAAAIADTTEHLASISKESQTLTTMLETDNLETADLVAERRDLDEKMARLRSCLAQATLHRTGPKSVASKSAKFNVTPSVPEMAQRLTLLLEDAKNAEHLALVEKSTLKERGERIERELHERHSIRSSVRESIAETEKRLGEQEELFDVKQRSIQDYAHKHDALKAQLEQEFIFAEEVVTRHKGETKKKLDAIYGRTEELNELMRRSERELRTLRDKREIAMLKASTTSETTLRLELQRAYAKRDMLRQQIAEERQLLAEGDLL